MSVRCFSIFTLIVLSVNAENLKLLTCNSVNALKSNGITEFVFIAMKKDDCKFLFNGSPGSKFNIEMERVSIPSESFDSGDCQKKKLTIYNYNNGTISLNRIICLDTGKTQLQTSSNVFIVSSSFRDSFSMKIRPIPDNDNVVSRNFVDGMVPPEISAEDFFFSERTNKIDGGFQPITSEKYEDFKPSVPYPATSQPFSDSQKEKPAETEILTQTHKGQYRPNWGYPGKPTQLVDITVNSTGLNFTVVSHVTTNSPGVEQSTKVPKPSTVQPPSGSHVQSSSSTTPVSNVHQTNLTTVPNHGTANTTLPQTTMESLEEEKK